MTHARSRPSASWAAALAIVLSLAGVPGEGTPAPPSAPSAPATDATAAALQRLRDAMPPEGSAPPDAAARARLCELWMAYITKFVDRRAALLEVYYPAKYRLFADYHAREFGSMGPEMAAADRIAERMIEWKIPCPPSSAAAPPPPLPGVVGSEAKGSNRTLLLVAGGAGVVGLAALAAGGGGSSRPTPSATPSTTPPVAQPPDVSSLHGDYN